MAYDWFIPPKYTQAPDNPRDMVHSADQITADIIGQNQLPDAHESMTNSSIQDQAYADQKTSRTLNWLKSKRPRR